MPSPTFNPADLSTPPPILSAGNLVLTYDGGAGVGDQGARATTSYTTPTELFFQMTLASGGGALPGFGLSNAGATMATTTPGLGLALYRANGQIWINQVHVGDTDSYTATDVLDCAANLQTGEVWFKNCTSGVLGWNGSLIANPVTGVGGLSLSSLNATLFPVAIVPNAVGGAFRGNFGATAYSCANPFLPGVPDPFCGALHTTSGFMASWTPGGVAALTYTVDYRKLGDVSFTEITGITDTSKFIAGLNAGSTYEFKVKAVNAGGESAFSDLVRCATDAVEVIQTHGSLRRTQLPKAPNPSDVAYRGDIMKWQRATYEWMMTVKARLETDSTVNTRPIGPLVVGTYTMVSTVTGTDDLSNFVATFVALMQGHGYTVPFDLRTNT